MTQASSASGSRISTVERPYLPAHQARPRGSNFTGTLGLLRLYLRRDRIVLPLWVLLLSVPLSTVYVGSTEAVYPTAADRALFAATIMASPAQRALYGQIYDDSVGAVGIWKAGMFHVLIAVAVILTVIRHTRADEESGRSELLDSTVVGRYASLTAAVLLAAGASVLTGVIGVAGLLMLDIPATGSLAFGLALTGTGLLFTAVAAVTAQVSPSARFARGAAFSVLAAAFTLRAVGDATSKAEFLSWASPLGWALQVRPFAGDRFWVLLPTAATTVVLIGVAYRFLAHRDVGAGLIAERPGPPRAETNLRGVTGLSWRLNRGSLAIWTVGLVVYGLLIGSVVNGIGDEIGASQIARDMVTRLGGTDAMEQAFVAVAFSMLGMVASAFAISLTLRLHQEESSQHAETLLAGAVGRNRWLASHLVFAVLGSAAALLIAGLATGLAYGASAGDVTDKLPTVLGTAAVQLPAVWLLVAVTVALFGLLPRFTPVAWGVLVTFIAVFLLGSLAGAPRWLIDLEPFTHVPHVGTGDFSATPLVWLLALDVALITLGVMAFHRRDVR
jgi:ABC-2 type transport system permease protein